MLGLGLSLSSVALRQRPKKPVQFATLRVSKDEATIGDVVDIEILGTLQGSTLAVSSGSLFGATLNSAARKITGELTSSGSGFALQETLGADTKITPIDFTCHAVGNVTNVRAKADGVITPTPTPGPPPAPTVTISEGSGYAGSTLAVANGGTGTWQVDAAENDSWADIPNAINNTYVKTSDGAPIRWRRSSDGVTSNVIHMWTPADLPLSMRTANSRWVDFKDASSVTVSANSTVAAVAGKFGNGNFGITEGTRMPAWGPLAAVFPEGGGLHRLDPSAAFAPRWMLMVLSYRNGTANTFTDYQSLITVEGDNTRRVLGEINTGNLFSPGWATTASKNGAAASAAVLPLSKDILTFSGAALSAALWSLGRTNNGTAGRTWAGPLFEFIALPEIPTGDMLERLLAYAAHRASAATVAKLATNRPSNPYLERGPQVS